MAAIQQKIKMKKLLTLEEVERNLIAKLEKNQTKELKQEDVIKEFAHLKLDDDAIEEIFDRLEKEGVIFTDILMDEVDEENDSLLDIDDGQIPEDLDIDILVSDLSFKNTMGISNDTRRKDGTLNLILIF